MSVARAIGAVGRFLIGLAIVMLLFAAYQLWGTGLQEARAQDSLRDEFDDLLAVADDLPDDPVVTTPPETAAPASTTSAAPTTTVAAFDADVARLFFPAGGDPVARLRLDTIGVEKVVVEGVQVEDLRQGPGHYTSTPMPGQSGNAAIAGHRTTYGAPFHDIDELAPGDPIEVQTVQGTFTYRVLPQPVQSWDGGFCAARERELAERETVALTDADDVDALALPADYALGAIDGMNYLDGVVTSEDDEDRFAVDAPGHFIISPSDTCVLDDFGDDRLTLTACHPRYSARQRIVVQAVLVSAPAAAPSLPQPVAPADDEGLGPDEPVDEIDDEGDETPPRQVVDPAPPGAEGDDDLGLDAGLGWSWEFLGPAAFWTVVGLALWVVTRVVARRWRAIPSFALAAVPMAVVMFLAFEQIDKLLPAY